jgi:hypothetical protein
MLGGAPAARECHGWTSFRRQIPFRCHPVRQPGAVSQKRELRLLDLDDGSGRSARSVRLS